MTAVVWWNLHPDECDHRSHWDTTLLQDLFAGRAWPLDIDLVETDLATGLRLHRLAAEGKGAILVVAGNFHRHDVPALNEAIAPLPWALVIVTSDEESAFPWADVDHPNLGLWIMTPGDNHPPVDDDPAIFRYIGEGYGPGTREALAADHLRAPRLDVWFYGRSGHERRDAAMFAASALSHDRPNLAIEVGWSPGFTQGLDRAEFMRALLTTKIALCPSGLGTADSFRAYEALEAGTLPIVDDRSPQQPRGGYWRHAFPSPPPVPQIDDWQRLRAYVDDALDGWPDNANRAAAWWIAEKRAMALDLRDDVDLLRGVEPRSRAPFATVDAAEVPLVIVGPGDVFLDVSTLDPDEAREIIWRCGHEWTGVLPVYGVAP